MFPLVESMTVIPGFRRPSARASRSIFRAGRSFTEPPGLKNSSLAKTSTSGPTWAATRRRRTRGVWPTASTMEGSGNRP